MLSCCHVVMCVQYNAIFAFYCSCCVCLLQVVLIFNTPYSIVNKMSTISLVDACIATQIQ